MKLLVFEIKKFIRQRYVLLGFVSLLAFGMLGVVYHVGDSTVSTFDLAVTNIGNATQTLFILFPSAFCGFLFSQEYRWKTIKTIKLKPKSGVPLFTVKLCTACIFSFVLFLLYFGESLVLGKIFFSTGSFTGADGTVIPASSGVFITGTAFFLQAGANLFIVVLVALMTILFRSAVLGFGGGLFVLIADILASNIDTLEPVLPLEHFHVWKHIITAEPNYTAVWVDLIILGVYSLFMCVVAAIVYTKREEKD